MHQYSIDNSQERQILPFFVAALAVATTFGAREVVEFFGFFPGATAYIPSSFAVYGLLYFFFDRFLWKHSIFQKLGVVKVPDMTGTWEGNLRSSHSDFQKQHNVRLMVHQTWSTVLLTFESEKSISRSKMASVTPLSPNELEILWEYKAEARDPNDTGFDHRGVTRLIVKTKDSQLIPEVKGDYYTQRGRDSNGTIELRRANHD